MTKNPMTVKGGKYYRLGLNTDGRVFDADGSPLNTSHSSLIPARLGVNQKLQRVCCWTQKIFWAKFSILLWPYDYDIILYDD